MRHLLKLEPKSPVSGALFESKNARALGRPIFAKMLRRNGKGKATGMQIWIFAGTKADQLVSAHDCPQLAISVCIAVNVL
jgi:hypothetical protein